jgi:hypothetical protein
MADTSRVRLSITFPGLPQSQAAERLSALRAFAQRKLGALEFVHEEPEGHLGVGLTFTVMVAVPAAALIWRTYFSEFGPRQPGKVRFEVDGEKVFEGFVADPEAFPTADRREPG